MHKSEKGRIVVIYEMVMKKISVSDEEGLKELLAHLMNEQSIGWHSVSPTPTENSIALRSLSQLVHQTLEESLNV